MALTLCASACREETPVAWDNACNDITTRSGGIENLIFFSCDWTFSGTVTIDGVDTQIGAITDYTQWAIGVANRFIVRSPVGIGEKPAATPTTQKLTSCTPDQVTGETHAVNFQSFAADTTNLTDCTYWNGIKTNYYKFRVAWLGCDELVYVKSSTEPGFQFSYSSLGYIQTNDSKTPNYYEANLTFDYLGIPCPYEVPNLEGAFNTDVLT